MKVGPLSYSGSGFDLRVIQLGFVYRRLAGVTRLRALSIGDGILSAAVCRTQAGASSDQPVDQSETRGDLREFCVIESCIVKHCGAD